MVVAASAPAACMGGVVTLTASGATSYLWSNGTTGPVISFTVTPNNNTLTVTGSPSTAVRPSKA
jgi:hypothetical protein